MSRKIIRTSGTEEETDPYPPHAPPTQPELPLEGLRRGDASFGVATLQRRIGTAVTGEFDEVTEYAVRRLQEQFNLDVNGVATPRVHGLLGLPWPPLDS